MTADYLPTVFISLRNLLSVGVCHTIASDYCYAGVVATSID
jgi:hypothetical protein